MTKPLVMSFFYGCSLAVLAGSVSLADAPAQQQGSSNTLQEVVVTARRTAENLQKTPVAVTVVSQRTLDQQGVFGPSSLTTEVPGLEALPNIEDRENIIYSIRGQNQTTYTDFPAVITYFNEVPITQLTEGQFFDLDNIQVLKGPQGVLFGRVTDGGNVLVTPKHPSNSLDGFLEVKAGDYGLNNYTAALNMPIIPDVLMARGAVEIDRRGGFTTNVFNGEKLDGVASEVYRLGVTWKPTSNFEQYTVVQYQHTHTSGTSVELQAVNPGVPDPHTGVVGALGGAAGGTIGLFPGVYGINANGDVVPFQPGLTPLTGPSYVADIQQQAALQHALGPRKISLTAPMYDERNNLYAVNTDTLDITPDIQAKNIFGYVREIDYESSNYAGGNGAAVLTCHEACAYLTGYYTNLPFNALEQFSEELQFHGKSLGHRLTWSAGFYNDYQHPAQQWENNVVELGVLDQDHVNYVTTRSLAGFGQGEIDLGDWVRGLKFNGGLRFTHDTVHGVNLTAIQPIAAPGLYNALLPTATFIAGSPAGGAALANATVNTPIPFGRCVPFNGGLFAAPCSVYQSAWNALTWTVGASYELPSGQMFYAKGSKGYRPGGVNGTPVPGQSPSYNPEFDVSVEVGFKGDFSLAGMPMRVDLALYHDNYTNIQQHITLETISGAFGVITNVNAAVIQGAELEYTVQPVSGLSVKFNFDYTDAHFLGTNVLAGKAGDPCDPRSASVLGFCPYNRLVFTPKMQTGLIINYTLPLDEAVGRVTIGGHYYYQSSQSLVQTSALNPESIQPGYDLIDLNASWTQVMGKPFDLSFFMTNVANKLYIAGMDDLLQNSSLGTQAIIWAPPRMFGFGLKYRFGAGAGG